LEKVLVLLSTYNGEKYLDEQLSSLKSQTDVDVDILVRDDGSKDRTNDILDEWQKDGYLSWYKGENLKPAKSFMHLIYNAPNYDYYAYCDQDDVWDFDKLKVAIEIIKKYPADKETLYSSTLKVVDEKLNFLYVKEIRKPYLLGESLIRNNVVGCTMVFNRKLLETLRTYKPEYIEMHDSWTYRVCIAVGGNAIIDNIPHINYRQHENNVFGSSIGKINRINNRVKLTLSGRSYRCLQTARELYQGYRESMSDRDKRLLLKVISYNKSFKNKIMLILDKDIRVGKLYQKILFVLDVLMANL